MASLSIQKQERITAYFFVLPVLIIIVGLMFYPIINVIRLSFLDSSFINRTPEVVGFQNYKELLSSSNFWKVMKNSVVWTVGVVVLQFIVGFGFALFLNSVVRGQGISRSLVLIPWVIPGVVAGIIWKIMYHPQIGIVNPVLFNLGFINDYVAFLSKETTAMPAVIVAAVWKGFPYNTVTLLAGLQSVRQDLIDCAMIDGAGPFKRLLNVIIPQLSGIIRINLMLTTIWTFNYFDITYSMTNGGPNQATQIFPLEIYRQAFGELRYSYSSSLAVISLIVIFIFTIMYIRSIFKAEE